MIECLSLACLITMIDVYVLFITCLVILDVLQSRDKVGQHPNLQNQHMEVLHDAQVYMSLM